ncbi:MAG: NAD(+) synthase [Candidatus Delongbacteria bacterium]|nr:NAD(+) synthase [Candidatus Delongbacteria bacterium]
MQSRRIRIRSSQGPTDAPAGSGSAATCAHLERFLKGRGLHRIAARGAGALGGIDSALAAALAVRALGAQNVHAIALPFRASSPASLADARAVADSLGLTLELLEISPMVDAFAAALDQPDALRLGNIMAQVRMTAIFDRSASLGALPLGTSNKTELLLGYGTWYGDLASAINPLGDLYKQQVFALSRHWGCRPVCSTRLLRPTWRKARPTRRIWVGTTSPWTACWCA